MRATSKRRGAVELREKTWRAPATILIVDDEPKNVDYLEQELEGFGYSTVSASNGAEALAIVQTNPSVSYLARRYDAGDGRV